MGLWLRRLGLQYPWRGGRVQPESVAAFKRNQWQPSPGIGGRFRPESVATFARNTHGAFGLKTLTGFDIDTSTPHGRLALQMFAALAEYERALMQERINAGIAAARARGRKGGRKPKLSAEQQQLAQEMATGGIAITKIAQTLHCSRHTVYKALAHSGVRVQPVP